MSQNDTAETAASVSVEDLKLTQRNHPRQASSTPPSRLLTSLITDAIELRLRPENQTTADNRWRRQRHLVQ